jgi:hypothetical protein
MHFNVYDVFYQLYSHQHVLAAIAAIYRVVMLREYRGANVCQLYRRHSVTIKNDYILS